ncbi:MAG: hypothetical protein ACO1SV_03930 [Fimbriimonas sp.]
MRRVAALAMLGLAATAAADRVLTVPTGRKIPFGTVRYEFRAEPKQRGAREHLLGVGIGTSFELEARTNWLDDSHTRGTFDLAYNVIAPLPDISPGISFGVQDALDETEDRRRFYAAITFRPVFTTANGDTPADVTLGLFQGEYTHPFVGVSLPFTREFRVLAEHNGLRPAAGFEYRPRPNLGFRIQFRESQTLASLQLTTKF